MSRVSCLFLGYLWRLLEALVECDRVELVGVGIEPQRERSREAIEFCERGGLAWFDARRLTESAALEAVLEQGLDLGVIGAFGQIIPAELIARARHGFLNAHFSRLPDYRGGCPIEEQILAGESEGGATLHWIDAGVDTGPIAVQTAFSIGEADDYGAIFERAHEAAARVLGGLLDSPVESWPREPQPPGSAATPPRRRRDARLDWRESAERLARIVRADGWKGWPSAPAGDGTLVVRRARVERPEVVAAPGTLIEAGAAPLVASGDGALRLVEAEGPSDGDLNIDLSEPLSRRVFSLSPALTLPEGPRVAMMQPTLAPWLGYLSLIAHSDVFLFLDDFQFTRRSWHQRNRIRRPGDDPRWLTVPVEHTGRSTRPTLEQVRVALDEAGRRRLVETLRHSYARSPFFEAYFPELTAWIEEPHESLAAMNIALIERLARWLGLETRFERSSRLGASGDRSERIAGLLRATRAACYVAAAGSRDYMLEDGVFPLDGIATVFQRFEPTPYVQGRSERFEPYLSALDALFCVGPDATQELIRRGQRAFVPWPGEEAPA